MSDEVMSSPKTAGEFASVLSDDEETPTRTRLRKDQRTVISLDGLANQHHSQKPVNQVDPILSSISFLLCVFDNIVGPKIVHHWVLDQRELDHVDEQLLKYVAVHTLNGELYQDKLYSNLKYRLYLIQEVDRAIFSVFFDASTVAVASSSNIASNHSGLLLLFIMTIMQAIFLFSDFRSIIKRKLMQLPRTCSELDSLRYIINWN